MFEYGQLICHHLNLLRRLAFGQTHPPLIPKRQIQLFLLMSFPFGTPQKHIFRLTKSVYLQKIFGPIDHHDKFQMFKSNFSGSHYTPTWQKINPELIFNPLFGPFPKSDQIQNFVVKDHSFICLKWCVTSQLVQLLQQFGC